MYTHTHTHAHTCMYPLALCMHMARVAARGRCSSNSGNAACMLSCKPTFSTCMHAWHAVMHAYVLTTCMHVWHAVIRAHVCATCICNRGVSYVTEVCHASDSIDRMHITRCYTRRRSRHILATRMHLIASSRLCVAPVSVLRKGTGKC